jgi:AraC-like DNA-binding protein
MYIEPVNLLQLFYVGLGVFGLILVSPIRRFNALGLLLCLQAVLMTLNFTEETGITRSVYLVTPIFTLGFGPAIYFFVRQVVYGEAVSVNNLVRHFWPMLVALPFTHWPQWVIACGSISQIIYLTSAIFLVQRYHRTSRQVQSDADALKLNWLNVILGIVLFMMLQDLVRLNLQPYAPLWLLQPWYFANIAVDFVLSAYLIVKAVRQPALFERLQESEALGLAEEPDVSAPVNDPEAKIVFSQIDQLIRTGELFKKQRLSLRDIADTTGMNEKNISWAINQGARKSFCDYINGLRVQAVCEQLRVNPEPATLLDIAFAMGFSAKSTFNTVFKKETGQTPSQFADAVAKSNFSRSES